MAQRADLEAAAAAGVISPEQAAALEAFLQTRSAPIGAIALPGPANGEEDLRFIRNFHDVFLSIGIVIFAAGMTVAGFTFLNGAGAFSFDADTTAWPFAGMFAVCAAAQWALAEVFANRRRLFLPSIVLCLTFVGFATFASSGVLGELLIRPMVEGSSTVDLDANIAFPLEGRLYFLLVALSAALATAVFWVRFRLPFAMGQFGFLAALSLLAVWFLADPDGTGAALPLWSLIAGLLLFSAGVAFDAQDPARRTLASDNGFWLHFAAAPLILNGVLSLTAGGGFWNSVFAQGDPFETNGGSSVSGAIITLVVVIGLGFVSLLINRRALIVSALLTTGAAIGVLVDQLGLDFGGFAAVTLLLLGGGVLLLGAGWHTARRWLLGWVKPEGRWARFFPPEAAAE